MNSKEITRLMDKTKNLIDELQEFYEKLKLECSVNEDETFSDIDSDSESEISEEEEEEEEEVVEKVKNTKNSNNKKVKTFKDDDSDIKSNHSFPQRVDKSSKLNDNKKNRKVSVLTKEIFNLSSQLINYDDLKKAIDSYIIENQLEEDGEITLDKQLKTIFNCKENKIKKKGPALANNIRKNLFIDDN
jgi:hypothetical protein